MQNKNKKLNRTSNNCGTIAKSVTCKHLECQKKKEGAGEILEIIIVRTFQH